LLEMEKTEQKVATYYWCKFYRTADWQVVKFWYDITHKQDVIKGMDWMSAGKRKDFDIFLIGPSINVPE